MKTFVLLALLVAAAAGADIPGVIECGGNGDLTGLRSTGCTDDSCQLTPGASYTFEADFTASATAPGLNLKVTVLGVITIINTNLPDSAIEAGVSYTIAFSMIPNEFLAGQTLDVNFQVSHSNDNSHIEFCANFSVDIV